MGMSVGVVTVVNSKYNNLIFSSWLPGDYLVSTWWLPGVYLVFTWWLHGGLPQSVKKRKALSNLKSRPSLSLCLFCYFPEVLALNSSHHELLIKALASLLTWLIFGGGLLIADLKKKCKKAFRAHKRFCNKRKIMFNRKDSNSFCAFTDVI